MIVSHRHKFIHVKAHKVGGSSVESALARHCDPEDIIFPMPVFDSKHDETPYEWSTQNCHPGSDCHMSAFEIKRLVGAEVWNDYLKIVEVRNTWDMLVSYFFWWKSISKPGRLPSTFSQFIRWHCQGTPAVVNHGSYFLSDEPYADFTIRFENLEDDTKRLFDKLGLEIGTMPRLKTLRPSGTKGIHYSCFYINWMVMLVRQKYRRQIEHFGYNFEDRRPSNKGGVAG